MKTKNIRFICKITQQNLKVIKCLYEEKKIRVLEIQRESISGLKEEQIKVRLEEIFKRLKLKKESVIISLPREKVTLRYLKVPSQEPQEIEKILYLQAQRFLPLPREELILGFSILKKDTEGFSYINLIIIHQDVINFYFKILKEFEAQIELVSLSSYGICNWFKFLRPKETEPVMIVDFDLVSVEVVILKNGQLLFSREFRFLKESITEEIIKTKEIYLKEEIDKEPKKIFLTGAYPEGIDLRDTNLFVEKISSSEGIEISDSMVKDISLDLIGLGLKGIPSSLNLLPPEIKESRRKKYLKKDYLKISLLFLGILSILLLAIIKNFYNKVTYLKMIKSELNKISSEAKGIEEMKRISEILEYQIKKRKKTVDIIYELFQLIPSDINLITLIYEEEISTTLRGQTQDLSFVFKFVQVLEKSSIFKNVKVRYASKRKISTGEITDFEIVCPLELR